MLNFEFYNPVHVVFGRETVAQLTVLLPRNTRIMLLYGGGSIKNNGAYDQTIKALQGFDYIEYGGIEPNPRYLTCMRAVEVVRKSNVGFILAVGGGSVVDAAKFIAAASLYHEGDPWNILHNTGTAPLKDAIPLGCVITLPATGSEMNCSSVISRLATHEKLHFADQKVFPKFAIIDPQFTFSLPERQTANGIVDAMVHVLEQYITYDVNTPLQDRMAEGIIKTLVEMGPHVMENPHDYEARANIFWCSSMALNGMLACGVVQDWTSHKLGHELTARYNIDHARTLAIVLPAVWRYERRNKAEKLLQYGREIWGIDDENLEDAIDEAIFRTEDFFHCLKIPTRLADYKIDAMEAAIAIRQRFETRNITLGEHGDIDAHAAYEIIRSC